MSNDEFDSATSGFFKAEEHVGRLILVRVVKYGEDYAGFGDQADVPRDGIEAEVTILDGDDAGREYQQSTVFQARLIGALKGKVGRKVLGRLDLGEKTKYGKKPYILVEPSDADKTLARDFLARQGEVPF